MRFELKYDGRYYSPLSDNYAAMFEHCTNGSCAITPAALRKFYTVFADHGYVNFFVTIDGKREPLDLSKHP